MGGGGWGGANRLSMHILWRRLVRDDQRLCSRVCGLRNDDCSCNILVGIGSSSCSTMCNLAGMATI